MTFFESGRPDSSWQPYDDPFRRRRREHSRRRVAVWSLLFSILAAALSVVVVVIGPENVATSARQLFEGEAPPPTAELVAVADKSFLTEEGRALLYASRPQLASIERIAEVCERPLDDPPAGCWNARSGLYVYLPPDERVADWAVTTLAHELLHAAYDGLGRGEIFAIHDMLEAEIARVPPENPVHEQITWSVGEHESLRETELFAYLGSQIMPEGGFAPELEAVYARFFTDRAALVAVHDRVDGVIDELYVGLDAAYEAVAAAESANALERAQLEVDRRAHEDARAQYNADADHYNSLPAEERGRWRATWTDPEGAAHSAPLGESLAQRLTELEQYRAALEARTSALAAAEAAAVAQRAAAEEQYADLITLLEVAYPGESYG